MTTGRKGDPNLDNGPLTAFGERLVAQEVPIEQLTFQYGLGDKVETFTATGGAATTNSTSEVECSTGTSSGGYGVARTKRAMIYRAGQGASCSFTARFTSPVALSLQSAGMFSATDAAMFGYNGTDFGVLYRYGGKLESRSLQITGAAGGSENATVTIDGTGHTIALTTGTVQHNAFEVVTWLNANVTGWLFTANDDTIVMHATAVGPKAGAFTFSSDTATGTFSTILVGVVNTEEWTNQDRWNRNPLTSNFHPSGLDPTKGNVYKIDFRFLGYGGIDFYILDPQTGLWEMVHQVVYANLNTSPIFDNPSLKGGWVSASLGSTTALKTHGASLLIANQGKRVLREEAHGLDNTKSIGTTLTNIITLRNRIIMGNKPNLTEIDPLLLTVSTESSKITIIEVYKNATIDGEPNFQYVSESDNITEYDTAGTTYTGSDGKLIASTNTVAGAPAVLDLEALKVYMIPSDTLTVLAKVTSGAASNITASINWQEDI